MKLWQLRRLSTGEALSELQDLPDNWKNILGLKASIDRLGDLTWAGHPDMGWIEVNLPDPAVDIQKVVDDQIAHFLMETSPMVAMDNTSMTKAERQAWMEYRKKLQEIPMQPNYPNEIFWPVRPE
jgi:hypothetical protein